MHFIFQGQQRLFSFYVSAGAVSATVHRKLSKEADAGGVRRSVRRVAAPIS